MHGRRQVEVAWSDGIGLSLKERGFAVVRRAFAPSDVERARVTIDRVMSDAATRNADIRDLSAGDDGSADIREMNHVVRFCPSLRESKLFRQCRMIAGALQGRRTHYSFDHAIYKLPGSGKVAWHQDQAYKSTVRRMRSIHFWIPLSDVGPASGCMQYVESSFELGIQPHERSAPGVMSLRLDDRLQARAVTCEAQVGDVILHLPLTIHGSAPNDTESTRKAWIIHFSPYGRLEPLLPSNIAHYAISRMRRPIRSSL